jgi:hypothetical protein
MVSSLPTFRLKISLHGTPFLVLAAFVRDGAGCQGSTWVRPRSGHGLDSQHHYVHHNCGEEGEPDSKRIT